MHYPFPTRRALLASLLASGVVDRVLAQPAAARQGRLVVPFPAGGPTDVLARILADGFQRQLQATFVVDNKPGATGNIGAMDVAKSAPDGKTLLITNTSLVMNPFLFTKAKAVDPFSEMAPVSALGGTSFAFLVPATAPDKSLREWGERMRKRGSPVSYGSFGVGATNHLAGHDLGAKLSLPFLHVPYKGDAPALQDLIGGVIDCGFFSVGSSVRLGDRVKVLAVTGDKRHPLFPSVPTFAEQGVRGFEVDGWLGLFAPAGTPLDVRRNLAKSVEEILATESARAKLADFGIRSFGTTPEQFAEMVQSESTRQSARIRAAGATLD